MIYAMPRSSRSSTTSPSLPVAPRYPKGPAAAKAMLQRCRDDTGADTIICGISGGKDSLVTLDLCSQVFPRIVGFFMYLVPGIRYIERHVDAAIARYRSHLVEVIRLPHFSVSGYVQAGVLQHGDYERRAKDESVKRLGLKNIEAYVKKKTGVYWVAYGMRMDESLSRRGWLNQEGMQGYHLRFGRVFPLWSWSAKDTRAYLLARGIPVPQGGENSGDEIGGSHSQDINFSGKSMAFMHDHHPEDYQRILAVFPKLEMQRLHWEMFGKAEEAAEKAARSAKMKSGAAARAAARAAAVNHAQAGDGALCGSGTGNLGYADVSCANCLKILEKRQKQAIKRVNKEG